MFNRDNKIPNKPKDYKDWIDYLINNNFTSPFYSPDKQIICNKWCYKDHNEENHWCIDLVSGSDWSPEIYNFKTIVYDNKLSVIDDVNSTTHTLNSNNITTFEEFKKGVNDLILFFKEVAVENHKLMIENDFK